MNPMMPGPMMPMPMDPQQVQQPQPPMGGMDPSMMGMDPNEGMEPQGMEQMGMPMGEEQQEGSPSPDQSPSADQLKAAFSRALRSTNLAKGKKEEVLNAIGEQVVNGYEIDYRSCENWIENNKKWLKLALLFLEPKVKPWQGASNVKYPLVTTAAMQFCARAYPTLVPADNAIVKTRVVGYDHDGSKTDRADRIAKHMSYQIMHKMPDWEEEMDKLLFIEAIQGVCFKKTYKDHVLGTVVSKMILPENLIVNYWAKSLESCHRKTEILYLTQNEVETKIRSGEFLDIDVDWGSPPTLTAADTPQVDKPTANALEAPSEADETTPHLFLAQHTFYDLDDDGYAEPLIIVVHKASGKVVRILARWDSDGMKFDEKGRVIQITPIEYFTDFTFIPNPDGSIYGLGFGSLLGPMNEAVNSLINQLVDAGTLNNLQSGFLSKGLRIQMKTQSFKPGEWKEINSTTEDLKNSIFPLPTKEPSAVLLNLMNMLIQSGNQLASVAEIFVGKMPGQNTPATTTQETVDQAMKVFTSIYKRNYRALLREFQKIYNWNRLSPEIVEEQASILDIPLASSDYDAPMDDIVPAADPSGASSTAQFSKLNMILQNQLLASAINPQEYTHRMLKVIEIPDPERLIMPPQPAPPDPKIQTEQAKQQTMAQKAQLDAQAKQQDMETKAKLAQMDMMMKAMELKMKQQEQQIELMGKQQQMRLDMVAESEKQRMELQKGMLGVQVEATKSEQALRHKEALNAQQLAQAKQKEKMASNKGNKPRKE